MLILIYNNVKMLKFYSMLFLIVINYEINFGKIDGINFGKINTIRKCFVFETIMCECTKYKQERLMLTKTTTKSSEFTPTIIHLNLEDYRPSVYNGQYIDGHIYREA